MCFEGSVKLPVKEWLCTLSSRSPRGSLMVKPATEASVTDTSNLPCAAGISDHPGGQPSRKNVANPAGNAAASWLLTTTAATVERRLRCMVSSVRLEQISYLGGCRCRYVQHNSDRTQAIHFAGQLRVTTRSSSSNSQLRWYGIHRILVTVRPCECTGTYRYRGGCRMWSVKLAFNLINDKRNHPRLQLREQHILRPLVLDCRIPNRQKMCDAISRKSLHAGTGWWMLGALVASLCAISVSGGNVTNITFNGWANTNCGGPVWASAQFTGWCSMLRRQSPHYTCAGTEFPPT